MARIQTTAAIAAAEMRKRLKAAGIAATVKSSNFAGGNSVDIGLTDAPPDVVAKAHKICDPFQYGHFDGMVDCYEYSNKRTDLPAQAKYVHVNLRTTPAMEQRVYDFVRGYFGEATDYPARYEDAAETHMIGDCYVSQFVWRQYCRADSAFWRANLTGEGKGGLTP